MSFKPRFLLVLVVLTLILTKSFGQAPVITHVDTYVNGYDRMVTISGSNFNPTANLIVWFGAAKGVIDNATDQTIEVKVPAGATFESIVVTNTSTGKSAQSKGEFMLSYGGENPIDLAKLTAQSDLDAETGLYDVCMCDLDGDGKNDVAGSNSGGINPPSNGISIFRNTSTPGTFSFASKVSLLAGVATLNIKCGDLNGDGQKELIVTEADPGTRIFILKNTGSLAFTSQIITVSGTSPKRVDVADLDGDGRPEMIITDQNTANKSLLIFRNTSSGATISFDPPISLTVPNTGSDGLAISDINNDNKPEIIISHVLSSSGNVYVYRNDSHPGTFVFTNVTKADIAPATPNSTGAPVNVRVGDIDGDSKPDIAVTHFLGSRISVLRNLSAGSSISFGPPVPVTTDVFPFGLDLGDIDGDKKLDIVVASLTGPVTDPNPKSLTIINNTSTPGNISFATPLIKPTTFVNRHVVIGDIDGDAKPDIAYTSVDDNTRGVAASKISFFRNTSCVAPEIIPGGPLTICTGYSVTLEATRIEGATYTWKIDGIGTPGSTPDLVATLPGVYTVDVLSDGCTRTSNGVTVSVGAGAASTPVILDNSPLCEGGTLNLSIDSPVGSLTYNWRGPGGFTHTGPTMARPSYVPEFAGRYEVDVIVTASGCLAAQGSTLVETISLPSFNVSLTGSDVICGSDTKTISVSPNLANFTYQWADGNGNISGAVGPTYAAAATGSYHVKATSTLYPGCPDVVAEPVDVLKANEPVVNFDSPSETCEDVVTQFTDHSTIQQNADPQYSWDFGDGGTGTGTIATHTYTSIATNLTVSLTVSYRGGACPKTGTKTITVTAPPASAVITTPGNVFEFCAGEQLTLGVSQVFSEYQWSTGETTPTVTATTGGNFVVNVKNSIGCRLSIAQQVDELAAPDIDIIAEKNPINLGESTKLSASLGFDAYTWTPADGLDNTTGQFVIAKPVVKTVYTVAVVGANGCPGTGTLTLDVLVDNPTNLLQPFNFFSPNGDASNPVWEVGNIENFPGCGVTIFDEKGVKVFEAKPYQNDWDGTSNGKKLPDGVYYYMIRCDGDSNSKTGSITILR